jgi:hypothetical protein
VIQTLVKTFRFAEPDRAGLGFSDSALIYLDSRDHVVRLRAGLDGKYPTADGIFVDGPTARPLAARVLLGFEVDGSAPAGTSLAFRLHNGSDDYWWNGAAWVVAGAGEWNTEVEVAANVATFPLLPDRRFGVVARLRTTDPTVTPELRRVKVLYQARIPSFLEDIVYRSLIPDLRQHLRPAASFVKQITGAPATAIALVSLLEDARVPFKAVDVEAVFDRTTDPDLLNDLLASYDPGTGVVTLTNPIPDGNVAQLEIVHEMPIAVSATDPDFLEVERVPSILLSGIQEVGASPLPSGDGVVNRATGGAVEVPAPYRSTLRMQVTLFAPSGVDLFRMAESLKGYADTRPILRSRALDEGYRLRLRDELRTTTQPGQQGLHVGTASIEVVDVLVWRRPAVERFAVQQANVRARVNGIEEAAEIE